MCQTSKESEGPSMTLKGFHWMILVPGDLFVLPDSRAAKDICMIDIASSLLFKLTALILAYW